MPDYTVPDSALIPTTNIYDIEQLEISEPGLKEFLVQLTQTVNNIALITNMKDTGYYYLQEFVNSQTYFPVQVPPATYDTIQDPRAVYRTVVWFDQALPNTGTITKAHNIKNIDSGWRFTRIYGCASNPTALTYVPIPYASTAAPLTNNIAILVDNTNVIISTGSAAFVAYTSTYVVLEYVKES
jgi:hypothetical protein